jgi:hypothetical protein
MGDAERRKRAMSDGPGAGRIAEPNSAMKPAASPSATRSPAATRGIRQWPPERGDELRRRAAAAIATVPRPRSRES